MQTYPKINTKYGDNKYQFGAKPAHRYMFGKQMNIYANNYNMSHNDSDDEIPQDPHVAALLAMNEKKTVFRDENHIYFRCDVTAKKINKLCNLIDEYNREQDINAVLLRTMIPIIKPLYVHITSNGGDLLAGFMAYDYIKNSSVPIFTVAEGYTISAGAIMFMAGKKRF